MAACGPGQPFEDVGSANFRKGAELGAACVAVQGWQACEDVCIREYERMQETGWYYANPGRRGCLQGVFDAAVDLAPDMAGAPS